MAISNVLLLSQISGYIVGLVLSLCIIISMGLHQNEFKGHCLLFSQGEWQEEDGQLLVSWASRAYCDFVMVIGFLMLIVSIVQIYRLSRFMYKGVDSSFLSAFVEAVVCGCMCIGTVSAAALVTLGFMTWCDNMVQRFPSCDAAAGQEIDNKDKISTTGFYVEMGTAQFGTWAAFATWVGLAVFSTVKLCRYHQLENIRVSMYRERQRLINEGAGGGGGRGAGVGTSTPPVLGGDGDARQNHYTEA